MIRRPLIAYVATLGPVGYLPAPGTAATLVTLPLIWFLSTHGVNGTTIVTESATKRAGLDGAIQTLDGLVFEGLVLQEAEGKYKKVGVVPDDEAVEKHLDKVKKDNNLSEDDLTRIFKESGYANYAEGFQKFKDMVTANSMLSFQAGKITVPERDVAAYCEAHPQMEEANFFIERGTVPAGEFKNTKELNNALKAARDNKKELDGVTWTSPFWLKKSDTAEEKAFIFDLKEGQHSSAHPLEDGGFEIYKVLQIKPERLRSIQERYHDKKFFYWSAAYDSNNKKKHAKYQNKYQNPS